MKKYLLLLAAGLSVAGCNNQDFDNACNAYRDAEYRQLISILNIENQIDLDPETRIRESRRAEHLNAALFSKTYAMYGVTWARCQRDERHHSRTLELLDNTRAMHEAGELFD